MHIRQHHRDWNAGHSCAHISTAARAAEQQMPITQLQTIGQETQLSIP